ncbi:MAG: hypothetical protein NVS2B12_28530 [Ktedonobacteraceae bacterium]
MNFRHTSARHNTYVRSHTRPVRSIHVTQETQRRAHMTSPLRPPRFSVIICTYNRRSMILTALAGLRKQTLPRRYFEVIVIDNGSTDGTFDAVQAYLSTDMPARMQMQGEETWRVQCLREGRNGLGYARKAGLDAATGEIVVFLDDDTLVDPHFLEQLHVTYTETGGDAVGGCVYIYWEAPRPYWLTDDLLEALGYFVPFETRTKLTTALSFSSSCFSVRREVLYKVGGLSQFLSKRLNMPISAEVAHLCQRLHRAGYALWYEPRARVAHRVSQPRLKRAFFVGRAYWQGRADVLATYTHLLQWDGAARYTLSAVRRSLVTELATMLCIVLIHRPLLVMAHKSSSERLYAMMAQARIWGRVKQQFILCDHAPLVMDVPAVLLVQPAEQDAALLVRGLTSQGVPCTTSVANIPFAWLWRHRAYQERAVGIVHFYRPGAMNPRQHQRLLFQIRLAQCLGVRVVSTDAGGWWQSVRGLHPMAQRSFERKVFACSDVVYTFTLCIDQLYVEQKLRQHACYIPHPGMRGMTLLKRAGQSPARAHLGFPLQNAFVYLCFADMHTEREVLNLIDAFSEMRTILFHNEETAHLEPQLALIGTPRDKKDAQKILKRAATNSSIHIFMQRRDKDMLSYIEAANAVVMPYFAVRMAGVPEMAMLFYSYERVVIAADLPRFQALLPPHACLLYDPRSRASFVKALLAAQQREYRHDAKEATALDAHYGWQLYAQRLLESYKTLLHNETR